MASIQSLGLGSGVLTTDLVDKIIGAERKASELRIDRDEKIVDAKITAYGEIQSLSSTLQSATQALASPSSAGSTIAKSSDETILTASASLTAKPGSYNIEVIHTAKQHSVVTKAYSSIDEIVGIGSLKFTFGAITYGGDGKFASQALNPDKAEVTIPIDDSSKTLSGIRDAINSKENSGIKASIINDGSGYRLVINSEKEGEKNSLRILALDSGGATATSGLSALGFNEFQKGPDNLSETAKGKDAELKVNGLTITRDTNTVTEVASGVTLNLKSADVGKTVNVTVEPDSKGLQEKLEKFVEAYNGLKKFTDDLTSFNAKTKQAGLLLGDSTVRGIQSQIRALISQPIAGLSGTRYRSLTELGVDTDRNNDFLLKFNSSVFNKAIKAEQSSIVSILAKSGSTTDSQISYVNDSINTRAGTYDVEVKQLATQAEYKGGSVSELDFSSPVIIDASNDNFTINVDGTNASISLTHGSYSTGEALANQIALQVNSDKNLGKKGSSVTVKHNAGDKNFNITSNKYGSESKISFTSTDTNVANTLGFNLLGKGSYNGVALTTLNNEAFNGKGAQTQPGDRFLAESAGINFLTSNATFSLDIGGGPIAVTVNQNAAGNDLNSDGTIGDRKDTLQAVQTAIDATALNGNVIASYDDKGFMRFTTSTVGSAQTINLTAVGTGTSDTLLGLNGTQGAQTNGTDQGLTFAAPIEFNMTVDGVETASKVSVPIGTYNTGNDLAAAVQAAMVTRLSAAPFAATIKGGESSVGTRDISSNIDFSTKNSGFTLNLSGVEKEIIINSDSGNNITDIQTAIDAAYGAGKATASLSGSGLKITSVATGHDQYVEIKADGRGAQTTPGAVINTGINFSGVGQNATFTLNVGGIDINVDVNGDGTQGSNNASSNLSVIQQSLNAALNATGEFESGDVLAKVDSSGQIFFETVSKKSLRTAGTYGSAAQVEIKNLGGTAAASLGLVAETKQTGYDALGFDTTRRYGYDVDPKVEYKFDAVKKLGSFEITVGGNSTKIGFKDIDSAGVSFLGLQDESVFSPKADVGQDVTGKINGVDIVGTGQFLTAEDGNKKATNGFYIANKATSFTTPVTLDSTNNKFKISVDGVEADITLVQPATYNSGASLGAALQKAINDNAIIKGKELAVKVDYTDDASSSAYQKFGLISASTGAKSEIKMIEVPAATSALFGFISGQAGGSNGKEQVGTIDKASGIRLKITGGSTGDRGSVTYVSGFADQLSDILKGFLDKTGGVIPNKQGALDTDKKEITEARAKLDAKLSVQEARLKRQFLYNDSIIAKLNSTGDFIKQQFEALNKKN